MEEFMTFSEALEALKDGWAVARTGWNGQGMYIFVTEESLYDPLEEDEALSRFIVMHTVQGGLVPWLASQSDLLSDDWEVVG